MNMIKKWFQFIFESKTRESEKKKVCWFFLGQMLGDLLLLTDEEIQDFLTLNGHEPRVLREIIREYVVPHYRYFPPENQEKIKNSLTYYLATNSEKLEWVFSSLHVPLDDEISKLFYTIIWQELYSTDFPEPINPNDYEEDCTDQYMMSLIYSRVLKEKYNPTGQKPSVANIFARLKLNT